MDITTSLQLLGGLTPQQFMRRHWQKKPLLVRQAIPQFQPLLSRSVLMALAGQDGVESRLLVQSTTPPKTSRAKAKAKADSGWRLARGPFSRRALPPFTQKNWTLLVQGVDLHDDAVHKLMQQFRFIPDVRLDDVMISYATDGGGVGPHFDSYDVFLLQAHGQRRWRIGRQKDHSLVDGLPLKILAYFAPEEEFVLEPGDMLYLPPRWAHDGIAVGDDCMTYSIGFRQPQRGELAQELLQRIAEEAMECLGDAAYRDPQQTAVTEAADMPAAMLEFARDAVQRAVADPQLLACVLGEYMTEPKSNVWFDEHDEDHGPLIAGCVLDRRTRMLVDANHVFINGESYRAAGRDAKLMRRLANDRKLSASDWRQASDDAKALLQDWASAGWLHAMHAS